MRKLFLILILLVSLSAKEYKSLKFEGKGIDFLVGDFASSTLYKVIGKEYPPFYTPWRDDPIFSDSEIEDYKERLKDYFDSHGYYKAKITITPKDDSLIVHIDKGEPIKVASIKVHPDSKFKNAILFKKGSIFNTADFTSSKKRIERYMLENAHPLYGFDAKAYVDLDRYRVDMDFYVDRNGTYYFGDTTINGREDVDEKIIKEALEFKKGEPFNIKQIESSYDKIYDLGVYDFITFKPRVDSIDKISSQVPIDLDLKMGETKYLKGSIGYSTNEGARGGIEWIDKNFFGNLKVFDIGFKVSQEGYEAYNIYYDPWIMTPYLGKITFENDINYKHYRYDSYTETTLLNRITFGKRLFDIEHYFGLLSEYSKIKSKTDNSLNESGNYFLNSLFYRFLIDKRDSKIDAQNGYYIALYLEKSMKSIGSDIDYFKSTVDLRLIKRISSNLVVGSKLRVGRIDADVPIFKRFFTGGANTNRGYEYRDFGEKDSEGVPYGGVSLVDSMFETRYKLWQKLWGVLFYDYSLLNLESDKFDKKYYGSYGFGFRYKTLIGPIRLDFGFPQKKDGFTFHLSIGEVF